MKLIRHIVLFSLFFFCMNAWSAGISVPLKHAHIDVRDKASLQRGARLYMNFCAGCHSLQYMRYKQMAEGIGLVNYQQQVDVTALTKNLIFTGAKIYDPILTAMRAQDARQWFGLQPPDLSLIARVRGADWLYTYLLSFYRDDKRPFGVNNLVFPDTAMPNILEELQGIQIPIYDATGKNIAHLALIAPGLMTPVHFVQSANDIVNFLVYVGEPNYLTRLHIGMFVLIFMIILILLAYSLKREYWKDID